MTLISVRILSEFGVNSGPPEVCDAAAEWQGGYSALPYCEGHLHSHFSVAPVSVVGSKRQDLSLEPLLPCLKKSAICTGWCWAESPLPWQKLSLAVTPAPCILSVPPFVSVTQSYWCIWYQWLHVPASSAEAAVGCISKKDFSKFGF